MAYMLCLGRKFDERLTDLRRIGSVCRKEFVDRERQRVLFYYAGLASTLHF